ncbi:hypothetical protein MKW98_028304 [Papaver atlanticum]|uniref:Protein TIC 22-like, chloroplastic n=1 Tax=Papaver atlanticum TaxID=357466 RepID=A0AAD4XLW9_9MAGN|nr:hypothetical protein MKW98_028304 [Papaver atlanticum]
MQFPKWNNHSSSDTSSSSSKTLENSLDRNLNLHEAFLTLQNNSSGFLSNLSNSFQSQQQNHFNLPFSQQTHFQFPFENIINQAKQKLLSRGNNSPCWARISGQNEKPLPPLQRSSDLAMTTETIEERLAGVPVYALTNSSDEFVLISGVKTGKSLGLFCFKKEDANALLEQMKSMDPGMRRGSKVVAVALNKVFQIKLDGVAFRFIPDSSEIQNAVKENRKVGVIDDSFSGVPVFQSQSLILKSQNKRYRPAFFRKEDLEKSLLRAASQQSQLNPAMKQGDIQVAVLEEIIKGMQESSTSKWDDVVFIPPGFDVSTDLQQPKVSATV